jgi:hypothetical protein
MANNNTPAGYPVQTSNNLTRAKVREGSSSATFNIRLPRWSGMAEVNTKSRGKPVFLTPVRQAPKTINYEAAATVTHTTHKFPFRMEDLFDLRAEKTVNDLVRLMQGHMDDVGSCFSSMVEMPRLYLELDKETNTDHLVIIIPPNMAFYTTYADFWAYLGFRKMDVTDSTEEIGGRGTRQIMTRVFGFVNKSQIEQKFTSRVLLYGITKLTLLSDFDKRAPNRIQFQVQIYDGEPVAVFRPPGQTPLTASTRDIVVGLEGLLEDLRYRTNYATNLIEVSINNRDPEKLYLSNRVVTDVNLQGQDTPRDYSTKLHLQFGPDLCKALGIKDTQVFSFDVEVPRTYSFKLKGGGDQDSDPFQGRYPLTMISQSMGQAHSYIEGLGYIPLMAVIHDQKRPIYSRGFEFETDNFNLTIEFYDKAMQKITFEEDLELILLIEFQRFCFCEQVWK